jgi:ferredoxin-NADP reductase
MTTSPGTLRVVTSRETSPGTHEVRVERTDRPGFEFVGGQYIIVNTGVTGQNGKPAKRAYSLVPCPEKPGDCTLTVKPIGLGSEALTSAPAGTELSFSGPWGKLVSAEDAHVRTLFVATDTGITAALAAAERRHPNRAPSDLEVLWLRSKDDSFIGLACAQERIARAGARWVHADIPPVLAGDRATVAHAHIEARIRHFSPALVLAAGDGSIVHPLRSAPRDASIRDVRVECFFHNPERKAS